MLDDWDPTHLFVFQSGTNVIITSSDAGFASGFVVANATVAQVQDQIFVN